MSWPKSDNVRLVINGDQDFGSLRPAEIALEASIAALEELSGRPAETRHARFSKTWKDSADEHKPAEVEQDADIEWRGIAAKANNLARVKHAARRAGRNATPVASLDDDLEGLGSYRVGARVPEQEERKFLQLIGFKLFAQIAEEGERHSGLFGCG